MRNELRINCLESLILIRYEKNIIHKYKIKYYACTNV